MQKYCATLPPKRNFPDSALFQDKQFICFPLENICVRDYLGHVVPRFARSFGYVKRKKETLESASKSEMRPDVNCKVLTNVSCKVRYILLQLVQSQTRTSVPAGAACLLLIQPSYRARRRSLLNVRVWLWM